MKSGLNYICPIKSIKGGWKFTQCYLDKKIYDLDEKVKKDIYSALFFCDDIQFL